MFKKLKEIIVTLAASTLVLTPVLATATAHAVDPHNTATTNALCNGLDNANGGDVTDPSAANTTCTSDSSSNTSINNVIHTVINLFSLIVGAVSIIMIIYGGFKYVTSGGNDSSVGSAKNTIVYALIGLVIVALAQVIVRFVLAKATA